MASVDVLITNLLNEKLMGRFENLETRFQKEACDIKQLNGNVEILKKTLILCEGINAESIKQALALAAAQALAKEKEKEIHSSSRTLTESSHKLTTHKREKSIGREKTLTRDKSVGKNLLGKSDDKTLTRDKLVGRNLLGKTEEKTMTKTKTVANLKKPMPEESKANMTKTKSTLNLKGDSSSNMSHTKTPKIEKKLPTALQSPEKSKSQKSVTQTPTMSNIKEDPTKTLKKHVTAIKDLKEHEKDKTIDKGETKTPYKKYHTKSSLAKEKTKVDIAVKTNNEEISKSNSSSASKKKSEGLVKKHPTREENISATIGVETHTNDELLTKDDGFLISGVSGFHDKSEIITSPSNSNKLDYNEILDDRWTGFSRYLNRCDHINIMSLNKLFGKLSNTQLITEVQREILENEIKIKAIREKNSNEDLNKEQAVFALSRGALKAVELLNENLYFKIFSEGAIPCDDIILTYRIFFQLLNKKEYAEIMDVNQFWTKACDYFVRESNQNLGTMVTGIVKNIDFSNLNIFNLTKLVGFNTAKITPNYFSKMCGTTGLFIFLIKDALEYAGVLVDKKTPPSRLYKNFMFNFEVLQGRMERLKKIQLNFFSN